MGTERAENISVLDGGAELLLLQVDPGYETQIAEAFRRSKIATLFKVIGKYDLLCLRVFREKPLGLTMLEARHWSHVVDYEHFVGFFWNTRNSAEVFQRAAWGDRLRSNWCAVSLARSQPQNHDDPAELFSGNAAASVEHIEHYLQANGLKTYLVLGGLGWFNHFILVWDADLMGIAKTLFKVSDGAAPGLPAFRKTFTLYGLSYDFILPEVGGDRPQWSELDSSEDVSCELAIACKSGWTGEIAATVRSEFEAKVTDFVFGGDDVVATSGLPLGRYFETLVRFREEYGRRKGLLFATATRLRFRFESACVDSQAHGRLASGGLDEAFAGVREQLLANPEAVVAVPFQEQVEEIALRDAWELHKRFSQMYLSAVQSPLTFEAYADMVPALCALKRRRPEFEELENPLREILLYLHLGYQQRSLGTLNSPWNFGNPVPLFYRGGMHQVIWAAEALVDSMLRQLNVDWNGFVLFGLKGDYRRSYLGVIEIPLRTALEPGEWWGTFHEAGHEYFWHRLAGLERLVDSVMGYQGVAGEEVDQLGRERILNQLWEAVSDIFDFRVGFLGEWELYKKTVIEYLINFFLASELKDVAYHGCALLNTALARSLLGYLCRLFLVYIDRVGADAKVSLNRYYESFQREVIVRFEELLKTVVSNPNLRLSPQVAARFVLDFRSLVEPESLTVHFTNLGYYRLLFHESGQQLLREVVPPRISEELLAHTAKEIADLASGRVLKSVSCPQAVICAMKRQGTVDFRFNVATILTLANMYLANLPAKVRAALDAPASQAQT